MPKLTVPNDPREQLSSMQIIVRHLDGQSPPFGTAAWQRVNEDAYIAAEPVRRMASPSGEGGSSGPVEVAEAPRRSAAAAIWPNLRSVGEG
jgi:hypothetical protein